MTVLRPGSRLFSAVDDTQVVVVRAPEEDLDLRCGGHEMAAAVVPEGDRLPPTGDDAPALVGKRYTREGDDLEILVTKAGGCGLALGVVPLVVRESKPLPASD